ncbi:oligosaccharide flippase family protein [Colwellia sp. 6M3]|jgi:O-antigen/teichoic acid export membrane protein|uniref:oligosaccharide flippase family protein n=1 Tax=Colwellia sp. 6M3 TaxID=2759849 RepID=UPI0015F4D15F|nr:oligosaccharide flippase family protein [Colwellia sp. 6M3]MBA6415544.1 oligosaccharide flippase family protein [Colwellia sp. 6M3]
MTNLSRERRNGILLSYGSIAIRNVAALLLIPFIINHLGVSDYGIYSLVSALAGYLIVLEFGLANTTIRFLSVYQANNEKAKESEFISSIVVIYGALALCVVAIGLIIWFKLPTIFQQSMLLAEIQLLQSAFLVLLINVVITLMSNSLTGIISTYQRFRFQKSTEILVFVARCIIVVGCLEAGFGVLAIVVVDTVTNLLHSLIRFLYIKRNIDIEFKAKLPDQATLKEIFVYSSFIALNVIVNQINWRVDNLIIGTLTNSKTLGIFNIGSQLLFSFIAFASAISNIFTPKIVQMVKQEVSKTVLMAQLCIIGRYQMIVLGYVFVVFAAFGELFIQLFVGAEFSQAYWVALISMVPLMFVLAQTSTNAVLQGLNKHKIRSLLLLVTAMANIIISIILVKKIGMVGASMGTAFALFVGELLMVNVYLYRVIGLNMWHLYREFLRYSIPAILLTLMTAFLVSDYVSASWFGLFIACGLTGFIYAVFSYFISLVPSERQKLNRFVFRRS